MGQKLDHGVKSKENLVNTLEVTVLTRVSSILVRIFVFMISDTLSKLGHVGSKLAHGVKLKENLVNTLEVTVLTRFSSNLV